MLVYTTNDLPGCPKGGLLLGTDKSDAVWSGRTGLDGKDGDDTIRGLGGSDEIFHGSGDDVIYAGPGNDNVFPAKGNDVIYGGPGNDDLDSHDDGGDKLYCGAGRDKYTPDKLDYVDSSCEVKTPPSNL
jgi:Ca2+-binding RTX toxin-like protein